MKTNYSIEDKPFYKFCHANNIGDYETSPETKAVSYQLSLEDLLSVAKIGDKQIVFDGINGGYIKGLKNNPEGGIFLVKPVKNNLFEYCGVILPGYYISNYYDNPKMEEIFLEIEKDMDNLINYDPTNFKLPGNCNIIDTGENVVSIILLANSIVENNFLSQFKFSNCTVVNRLPEILEIENSFR